VNAKNVLLFELCSISDRVLFSLLVVLRKLVNEELKCAACSCYM